MFAIDSPDGELAGAEPENRLAPVVAGEIEAGSVAAARGLEASQPEREVNRYWTVAGAGDGAECFSTVGDFRWCIGKNEEVEGGD